MSAERTALRTAIEGVGCGTGAWLSAFAADGTKDVFGLDGVEHRRDIASGELAALAQRLRAPIRETLRITVEIKWLPPDTFPASLTRRGWSRSRGSTGAVYVAAENYPKER